MNDIIAQITVAAVFIAVGYIIGLQRSRTEIERYRKRAAMCRKVFANQSKVRW